MVKEKENQKNNSDNKSKSKSKNKFDAKSNSKPKKKLGKKGVIIIVAIVIIIIVLIVGLWGMTGGEDYPTPSEILKDKTKHLNNHVEVRGTVKQDTLDTQNKTFVLTDDKADLLVNYTDFLPSNFEEGKDVVVKGTLREQIIVFIEADEIVVGCASKY